MAWDWTRYHRTGSSTGNRDRHRRRRQVLVTIAVTSVLALAGCGSGAISAPDEPLLDRSSPSEVGELVQALRDADASTLASLIEEHGIVGADGGAFTLLAPSDDAFAALDADSLASLLSNDDQLRSVLSAHVLDRRAVAADLLVDGTLELSDGTVVEVVTGSTPSLGDAAILTTDIEIGEAVVHVVDRFLVEITDERVTS